MTRLISGAAGWLGGWWRLALLIVVVVAIAGGLYWERWRHPPFPAGATQPNASLMADVRQTTFWAPGSADDMRAFYRQELPPRGWKYCGKQTTKGCTNLIALNNTPPDAVDVYRRTDDTTGDGPTIEVWPVRSENGKTYVTVFETRGG